MDTSCRGESGRREREREREREKGKPCMAVKRMAAITFVGLSRTHLGERSLRI